MRHQLESFFEQRPQHGRNLLLGRALRHFGQNIESLRRHPIRTGNLERLHLVSLHHQIAQRRIADVHSSGVDLRADMQLAGCDHVRSDLRGRADRGHLECGLLAECRNRRKNREWQVFPHS